MTAELQIERIFDPALGVLEGGQAGGQLTAAGTAQQVAQNENTFILDSPFPMAVLAVLGELGETEFRLKFNGEQVEVSAKQVVFGSAPFVFSGKR